MTCIAPSLVLTPDAARSFGAIPEAVAAQKYKMDMGRAAFFPLPPGVDFFDIAHGFGNTSLYAAFLASHHPTLNPGQLKQLSDNKLLKIPDLMSYVPPTQTEFYEIKPNSGSGRSAGAEKIARIAALCATLSLPYVPGVKWSPDIRFILFSGGVLGIQVDVFVHIFRTAPGLILYEVCAEGKRRPLTNWEVAAIIAIVLLAVLAALLSDGLILPALAPAAGLTAPAIPLIKDAI